MWQGLKSLLPTPAASDHELMRRVCASGDAKAFELLVQRWQSRLQRYCYRMTGSWPDAEDLAQETFTRVFENRHRYKPEARFSTFLWRIAINLCHDFHRRKSTRSSEPLADDQLITKLVSPQEQLDQQDECRRVQEALLQLPPIYREVVILRHYEKMKLHEIAESLQIPTGTVSSRMASGLKKLAKLFNEDLSVNNAADGGSRTQLRKFDETSQRRTVG